MLFAVLVQNSDHDGALQTLGDADNFLGIPAWPPDHRELLTLDIEAKLTSHGTRFLDDKVFVHDHIGGDSDSHGVPPPNIDGEKIQHVGISKVNWRIL